MSIYVALLAGCVLTMILGKFVLAELRKLKAGQEIRQDGPTWHNSKAGCWRGASPICMCTCSP